MHALHRSGLLDRGLVRTVLLPGYGRPGRNRMALAPQVLARAVVAKLGRGAPALLVGLSAGCQVAAQAALQAPERVAGLVLVGPTTDPRADSPGWYGGRPRRPGRGRARSCQPCYASAGVPACRAWSGRSGVTSNHASCVPKSL